MPQLAAPLLDSGWQRAAGAQWIAWLPCPPAASGGAGVGRSALRYATRSISSWTVTESL
jgi:hypothetical protein